MSDYYDSLARLYDLEHRNFGVDLLLYQNFGRRCGGPVLDVGCGSGRVTLAVARTGLDVVGVDNSVAMLDLAYARVREEGLLRVEGKEYRVRDGDVIRFKFSPR